MKQNHYLGLFLSILFVVLIYFFTRSYYSPFFWMVLGVFLLLAFLKEENRLFAWVMLSFFGGNFILIYFDKFIQVSMNDPFYRVILNQFLFIIPILSMCYVIKQFNKRINYFFKRPEPLGINKLFSIILLLFTLSFIFIYLKKDGFLELNVFLSLVTFSTIYAVMQEVIWRGILLTQMIKIMSETTAILFSSIAFAVNTTIFGFSPVVILLYLLLGILLGFLTTKFKSILPPIVIHTLLLIFCILNGWIQLPIV